MVPMMVTITLFIDVDTFIYEEAREILRNTDDPELFELAKFMDYEYELVE